MRDTLKTMSERQPSRHKKGLRFWLSRGLLGLGLLLVALLLAGAGYQAIATRADARNYPPPGRLVDVGGYQLHIHCLGSKPLPIVLGSEGDGSIEQLQDLFIQQAALSSNSFTQIVDGATHAGLVDNQDHALQTSAAIQQIVESARTGQPLLSGTQ